MELSNISDNDLEKELEKRRAHRYVRDKPKPISRPNFSKVTAECVQYIDTMAEEKRVDDSKENFIFETAMEAVFGEGVWDWVEAVEEN